MPKLSDHAAALGLTFRDERLFAEALTHRSYLNEHKDAERHNERLEFLGDAVLQLSSADYVFKKFPNKPEGYLTQYRAAMVNAVSLSEVAQGLGMNDMVLLSKGEARDSGKAREAILANAFEAVLGALYLDQGYEAADAFLQKHLFVHGDTFINRYVAKDAKSRFQERAQAMRDATPVYRTLSEEGPDHDKVFTIGVFVGEEEMARGQGRSKQEGEQAAAQAALDKTGW